MAVRRLNREGFWYTGSMMIKNSRLDYIRSGWATGDYKTSSPLCPLISEGQGLVWEEHLDGIYGEVSRRISCEKAMMKLLAVPMMACLSVNAARPEKNAKGLGGKPMSHYYESERTLHIGAWQIAPKTWISTQPRSVLDAAFYSNKNRTPEFLLRTLTMCRFSIQELADISEQTEMGDAIRRLASISALVKCQEKKPWLAELREYGKSLKGDLVPIWTGYWPMPEHDTKCWIDEEFNVAWNINREEIQRQLIPQ